jgi:hypothetical protein
MFRRNHAYHLFFFLARELFQQVSGVRCRVSAKRRTEQKSLLGG